MFVESSVIFTSEPNNPTKILVNTTVAYLRWNYSIGAGDSLREVDFIRSNDGGIGVTNIGFIDDSSSGLYPDAREDYDLIAPATLVIRNVTEDDKGTFSCSVKTQSLDVETSSITVEVLGM